MKFTRLVTCCFLIFISSSAIAQEVPTQPKPTKQHEWLKKFVGNWETQTKSAAADGAEAVVMKGTIQSQMLGEFWVINRMQANAGGFSFRGLQTIGYDEEKKKFVGTWVDSMGGFMWKYEGTLEKDGTKIVLNAEGPDMTTPGKMAKYRDTYEFKSADEMIATSLVMGPNGKWTVMMNGTAKRVKSQAKKK